MNKMTLFTQYYLIIKNTIKYDRTTPIHDTNDHIQQQSLCYPWSWYPSFKYNENHRITTIKNI